MTRRSDGILDRLQGPVVVRYGSRRIGEYAEVRWKRGKFSCDCKQFIRYKECGHVRDARAKASINVLALPETDLLVEAIQKVLDATPLRRNDERAELIAKAVRALTSVQEQGLRTVNEKPKPMRLIYLEE